MFKTDWQKKDKISCAKDFISVHMQTLALKCSQKNKDKKNNSSGLKINPIPGRVFWLSKAGGVFGFVAEKLL